MATRILFLISGLLIALTYAAVPLVTEPKPGEEFVYVQRSGSGARPIARKEKATSDDRPFETAHKLPPSLTYVLNQNSADDTSRTVKQKREARPARPKATTAAPAPAPAGSIKIDPLKLIEKYKSDLITSSTAAPKAAPKAPPKSANRRRTKKDARSDPSPTSPRPVLTSGAPPTPRTLHIPDAPLVASGTDKQRSRIQIKKGPNGQEYEYEYVYYYYDDDDDKETTEKVLNSHDGPARDELSSNSEEKTHYSKEAASNEVIPSGRGRARGRQLEDEDTVGEERLPPSTRFPPRSRNLATTPATEEESKATRGRGRGRPTTVAPNASSEADSVSEETQGSRGRTRANVRRPSLDLVDSASFNTQSGTAGSDGPNGPSFPSDLPSGPVRFLGATPNERMDLQEGTGKEDKGSAEEAQPSSTEESDEEADSTVSAGADATTTMISPMDKVALDLYAILQGTQKLSGEGDVEDSTATTDGADFTTLEAETTEVPTTEYTTSSTTTTTTTTTTTPAPTTTTTTEAAAFGRGSGFRRGGAARRKHGSTTAAPASTESSAPSEPKTKSRFNRPSFGRPRPGGARTTSEPAHEPEATKEEAKPASRARPTSKSRFGGNRSRPSTTESSGEHAHEESASSSSKPALSRPRPAFNVRGRGRSTTAAPAESDGAAAEAHSDEAPSSTTSKPKVRAPSGGSNVRPLRPGPRINIRRPGAGTTTTVAPEVPAEETPEEEAGASEEPKEETPTSPAPVEDKNPLHRLRNRQRVNAAAAGGGAAAAPPGPVVRPKAAASASVQVRRVNPLIGRRRPGAAEPSSTEAPQESEPTESAAEASEDTEASAPSSSTTTEEPKGLNKLLAGRRRLAVRQPGSHK